MTLSPTSSRGSSGASFATPAVALASTAGEGAAATVIRSDSTIAAFDTTAPSTQAFGDAAAVGTAAFAARRDHVHAMPANPYMPFVGWPASMFVSSNVGTWAFSSGFTGTAFLTSYYNSTQAIDDAATWSLLAPLPAGTYTLTVSLVKNTSYGIGTWETSPDGSSWTSFGTIDCYNGTKIGVNVAVAGVSVAAAFKFLRVRIASKNASSASYYNELVYVALARTA